MMTEVEVVVSQLDFFDSLVGRLDSSSRTIFLPADLPAPDRAFLGIIHRSHEPHAHFLQDPIRGVDLGQRVRDNGLYLLMSESIVDHRPCSLRGQSAVPIFGSNLIADFDRARLIRWTFEAPGADEHSLLSMNKEISRPVRWKWVGLTCLIGEQGKCFREVRPAR